MELLGVQKLTTRSSRNKMLRFKWEPEGTYLLFKEKDGYMEIKKTENLLNVDMKQVGLVRNCSYPAFLYVSVLHLVPYEGYITVFKKDNGVYIIKPSTDEEISLFALKNKRYKESGHVIQGDKSPSINLIKEDHERLFSKGYLKYHVVQNGQKLYLRVFPVIQEEAKDLPSLAEAASVCNGWEHLGILPEYIYMSEVTQSMRTQRRLMFPVSFLRKTGAKKGDHFQTWFEEDGSFIVEPNPINCDVCGKPIRRYLDPV